MGETHLTVAFDGFVKVWGHELERLAGSRRLAERPLWKPLFVQINYNFKNNAT